MVGTSVNDLVNKQSSWEFVFGTSQIQVSKVSIDTNGTLFFINGNMIGNPSGIHNGVYKSYFMQLLDLSFNDRGL